MDAIAVAQSTLVWKVGVAGAAFTQVLAATQTLAASRRVSVFLLG
jgi:hypothetical protein